MKQTLVITIAFLLYSCFAGKSPELVQYVDPFIGTGGHGHTFPGAVMPHGMVQLSPDTRMTGWDACSGYHYSDNTIIGFSHTHLSGTGIGDYGDILFMPTSGTTAIDRGEEDDTSTGYRSKFSHNNETALPGYYSVLLEDYDITAELTATTRAGMHRYTFNGEGEAAIVVDLSHTLQNHENALLSLHIISDREIEGIKKTKGWAKDHTVCFYARFSEPFKQELYLNGERTSKETLSGECVKARLVFDLPAGRQVLAAVGISAVDTEGARGNLLSEIDHWDFDKVRGKASKAWNDLLSSIEITTDDVTAKRIFYTGLYHANISPNIYIDYDKRYRGQDLQVHSMPEGNYYTIFSLWDTFRAVHPLQSIVNPGLNNELAATLVKKYMEGGHLPMWELASNYTGTMIGYHAVSVITEAYLKGARNFDPEIALQACIEASRWSEVEIGFSDKGTNAGQLKPIGLLYKDSLGYVPCDIDNESVAKGLEYAYNDWCIAQFAKALGKTEIYVEYMVKAGYWRNYFDPDVRFMRGKTLDGKWNTPFNPAASNHRKDDYCEGNAWQWSWYVMHDVPGMVEIYGGKEGFVSKLDSLFSVSSELVGEEISSDISGLIGQYAHGNEPSHHITHLYNYVGQSWKTQELVDSVLYNLYFDQPDGLSGNEDCGQISAWYILNSIGIYSVAPTSGIFSFGRPIFDRAAIKLDGGKKLIFTAKNNSRTNKYIQSVKVNGEEYNSPFIDYKTLMEGARIEFVMGPEPNYEFGTDA